MTEKEAKEILRRYRSGNCTEAEKKAIEAWLAEEHASQTWSRPEAAKQAFGERLKGRIDEQRRRDPQPTVTVRPLKRYWYAAAVVFALSASVVLYWNNERRNAVQDLVAHDIAPGRNRATLTLADGRSVDLRAGQSGIVVGDGVTYKDGTPVLEVPADGSTAGSVDSMVLTTPLGGTYQVTLPDGTRVWLNAASTLKYPGRFADGKREVALSGEGYFAVAKDERRPFRVITQGQAIQVLGTQFNVTAYADEPDIKTTLVEGSVQIVNTNSNTTKKLSPGEQAISHGSSMDIQQVNIQSYTAWKDGMMVWTDVSLPQAIRQIERWYDVEFESPPTTWDGALWGSIPREVNLSEVLAALELNTGLKFRIAGRRVVMD